MLSKKYFKELLKLICCGFIPSILFPLKISSNTNLSEVIEACKIKLASTHNNSEKTCW